MQVEVSMTAAESAEYYPPVIRERGDAHYCMIHDGLSPETSFGC
jgi:hypothetical protein